ncbi:MAG: hypothetical protein RLW61_08355 [Gammaproteobacteria bacterium]
MPNLIQPALIALLLLLGACEQEGPMERAGEQIDETVEEAGDEIEDATEQ